MNNQIIQGRKPFKNFKVYGPYLSKKENRRVVVLVNTNTKIKTSMSYARYLVSVDLGRELTSYEQADHIDNNKTNDSISNLQLLTKQQNIAKGRKRAKVLLRCVNCNKLFTRYRNRLSYPKIDRSKVYCNRQCAKKRFGPVAQEVRAPVL